MDMQRKVSFGRGAGRSFSMPTGTVVSAPGPLATRSSPLTAGPSSAFTDPVADINNSIINQVTKSVNSLNAVAIKLPELWRSNVRSCFAQAKAKFVSSGVTASLMKYYHVIKALRESSIELDGLLHTRDTLSQRLLLVDTHTLFKFSGLCQPSCFWTPIHLFFFKNIFM